jgi:hypothetical protein
MMARGRESQATRAYTRGWGTKGLAHAWMGADGLCSHVCLAKFYCAVCLVSERRGPVRRGMREDPFRGASMQGRGMVQRVLCAREDRHDCANFCVEAFTAFACTVYLENGRGG